MLAASTSRCCEIYPAHGLDVRRSEFVHPKRPPHVGERHFAMFGNNDRDDERDDGLWFAILVLIWVFFRVQLAAALWVTFRWGFPFLGISGIVSLILRNFESEPVLLNIVMACMALLFFVLFFWFILTGEEEARRAAASRTGSVSWWLSLGGQSAESAETLVQQQARHQRGYLQKYGRIPQFDDATREVTYATSIDENGLISRREIEPVPRYHLTSIQPRQNNATILDLNPPEPVAPPVRARARTRARPERQHRLFPISIQDRW